MKRAHRLARLCEMLIQFLSTRNRLLGKEFQRTIQLLIINPELVPRNFEIFFSNLRVDEPEQLFYRTQ